MPLEVPIRTLAEQARAGIVTADLTVAVAGETLGVRTRAEETLRAGAGRRITAACGTGLAVIGSVAARLAPPEAGLALALRVLEVAPAAVAGRRQPELSSATGVTREGASAGGAARGTGEALSRSLVRVGTGAACGARDAELAVPRAIEPLEALETLRRID